MRKRFSSLLICFVLLNSVCFTVFAHDYIQFDKKGSIEVILNYNDFPVSGGTLSLFKVADVVEDDGNYSFSLTEEFAKSNASLEDINSEELVMQLEKFSSNAIAFETQVVGEEGIVVFEELEVGLYLLIQRQAANGYAALSPFLVSVPYMIDGKYEYDVVAAAKTALEPVLTPTPPPSLQLPDTGQLNWPVPVLAVGGLVLFMAGWLLCFNMKEVGNEE